MTNGNESDLVRNMIERLENLVDRARDLLQEKFRYAFEALEQSNHVRKDNITQDFQEFIPELVILGFNSGTYSLQVIKPILIWQIKEKIDFVIKKVNSYLCVKTDKLRFLDIKNYLAPRFSYAKFLKAYGSEEQKFYFPYEFSNLWRNWIVDFRGMTLFSALLQTPTSPKNRMNLSNEPGKRKDGKL